MQLRWLQSYLSMYSICNITRICALLDLEQSGEFASGSVATLTMSFYSDDILRLVHLRKLLENFSKSLRKSK
ncbi:hypothetical protein RIR_jg41698.t1 [Rhizophagus irregularis DAOM 181602=DAOM 197198]|nr:hypothetical protein RIR_jg41698.t1 [Rhizophagus irregularis DAOM 181602=DAOM 197198]